MLIFGSTALNHWFPDSRTPKDLDIIDRDVKSHNETYWVPSFEYILENNKDSKYVDPNFLYTIKLSHSFWDVKWDKTIFDIIFLKSKGCIADEDLYKGLVKDWQVVHGKKKVNLNKENKQFFSDNVTRKYDHDDLHLLVKHYSRPLYESIKSDLNSAKCEKNLFTLLSHDDKILLCREEIFVVALERFLIPSNFHMNQKAAINKAIKQLVTTMTTGWFPRFIVENIKEITNIKNLNLKQKL